MRALWDFPGGLELPSHSAESTARPVRAAALPDELIIPLQPAYGQALRPTVAAGDRVRTGDRIAEPVDALAAPVHAGTSGVVQGVEERPIIHPSGLPDSCLVITSDGADEASKALPPLTDDEVTAERLAERARACGVVGLGGAAFPTHAKCTAPGTEPLASLIINGAECESWITADEMLMRTQAERVIQGTTLTARALQPAETVIAVEADKEEALDALTAARDAAEAPVEIVAVPARYPVGGEKQLIQVITGREVPSGDVPPSIGVVSLNVATVAALRDAVCDGRPVTRRLVAVTGDAVNAPQVLAARIGTPGAELIAEAGGYSDDIDRLVAGGPMMGTAIGDDAVPVTRATHGLLAGSQRLFPAPEPALPCIRCSACADACPVSLLPQQLYWYARADDLEQAEAHQLDDCIDCGVCAAVCPSHIPLVDYFRYAKDAVAARDAERRQADQARQRYEARRERLAREEAEKRARREAKKAAVKPRGSGSDDERKQAVQAALARARQRKRSASETDNADNDGGAD